MTTIARTHLYLVAVAMAFVFLHLPAMAQEIPLQLADPSGKPAVSDPPVKVYILSGQSNMVGIGQVNGGFSRWSDFSDLTVSVYQGTYSATTDYDQSTPIKTKDLPEYGGVNPTPFPGGGVQVVRGWMNIKDAGLFRFKPGYQASTFCIMELDGVEVYRREVGKDPFYNDFKTSAGKKYSFKLTFLTAAADGLGWFGRIDVPGTLHTVVHNDGKFPHLVDDAGNWTVRNDVWYKGVVTATANKWLTVGCGSGSHTIGPELQFGHIMGDYHDEPVIILKASQGNRSLGWDILPPGSERFTHEGRTYAGYNDSIPSWTEEDPGKEVDWYAGKQYDDFVRETHAVLDNFSTHFPQYKDQGFEIAGFVWWQGHKDGNAAHASRYEVNLVHYIRSIRAEFKAPEAPLVIATIGFNGWEMAGPHVTVASAQLAVSGETGKYPEFSGNVLTVETRDFWKDAAISPRNQGFHYNQNAETYMLVGDSLGNGMVQLLKGRINRN